MLSTNHFLAILSFIFVALGAVAYIRDTLKGKTKPNRLSWLMWSLAPLISSAAALYAHADFWVTFRVTLSGLLPLTIFFCSFINPNSYWKLTPFDFICGVCSLLAIILWVSIDSPQTAIILALLRDAFAAVPTLRKAWQHPETETGITYIYGFIAGLLILPSIRVWNIQNSAFQIYLILMDIALAFAVYFHKINKKEFANG